MSKFIVANNQETLVAVLKWLVENVGVRSNPDRITYSIVYYGNNWRVKQTEVFKGEYDGVKHFEVVWQVAIDDPAKAMEFALRFL